MNFSFLNPLFLIGVTALALPIIAHIISRKSGIKKKFPAVTFLLASRGDTASKSRLKDLVLLILRSIIVVLIVLVFAKPAVFSLVPAGNENPRSVAIVIDNSFSMEYDGNFKRARQRALNIINTLPDGSFGLAVPLVTEESGRPSSSQDLGKLRDEVNEIELSSSFTDNEKRLEQVYAALGKAPTKTKQVVLITDMQKNGWKNEAYEKAWLQLIDITKEPEPENRAVTDAGVSYARNSLKLSVEVSNYSEDASKELLADISVGGEEMKGFFNIEPWESGTKEFTIPKEKFTARENLEGFAEITHDRLKIDDTRYFVLSDREDFKVLIVDGDPREDSRLSETYYLARAAETIAELSGSNISVKDNDSFLNEDLSNYDLIFLANVGDITPRNSEDLESFIESGGTLVIFLGERIRSSSYNTLLKNILPGELLAVKDGEFRISPLSAGMFADNIKDKTNQVRVNRYVGTIPSPGSDVIFSISAEEPFLISKDLGRGSVFLFTSTADASWNNFPITPVFLPVVKKFMDFSGHSNSERRNYIIGETVAIDISPGEGAAEIINASGDKFEVGADNPLFAKTYIPGIYTVTEGGKTSYKFSVNIDPAESNLARITAKEIEAEPENTGGFVKVFREIWKYFLWGALALFISESIARAAFS
ncbi:MAG: BatA domain-containing protein [Deltaproteobacteria bacterium]